MVARLAAFLLALVVTGAPVSLTACEILCAAGAGHGSHDEAAAPRHSCHGTQENSASGAVGGQMHACGHVDRLPVTPAAMSHSNVQGPGPAVMAAPLVPSFDVSRRSRSQWIAASPPAPPTLHLPLRI